LPQYRHWQEELQQEEEGAQALQEVVVQTF
jgi:hypothetical protein